MQRKDIQKLPPRCCDELDDLGSGMTHLVLARLHIWAACIFQAFHIPADIIERRRSQTHCLRSECSLFISSKRLIPSTNCRSCLCRIQDVPSRTRQIPKCGLVCSCNYQERSPWLDCWQRRSFRDHPVGEGADCFFRKAGNGRVVFKAQRSIFLTLDNPRLSRLGTL